MITKIVQGVMSVMTPEEEQAFLEDQETFRLSDKLDEITYEANRRIQLIAPEDELNKNFADAMVLIRKEANGTITVDELTKLNNYQDLQQQTAFIRAREADLKTQAQEAADPSIIEVRSDLAWS